MEYIGKLLAALLFINIKNQVLILLEGHSPGIKNSNGQTVCQIFACESADSYNIHTSTYNAQFDALISQWHSLNSQFTILQLCYKCYQHRISVTKTIACYSWPSFFLHSFKLSRALKVSGCSSPSTRALSGQITTTTRYKTEILDSAHQLIFNKLTPQDYWNR